jgi:CBS domain-containing protein
MPGLRARGESNERHAQERRALVAMAGEAYGQDVSEPGGTAMPETFATTVREAMHKGCECIGENQSLLDAAKRMEALDIGAMPICGQDDRLKGMITDRDIVVKALAHDKDPATMMAGELAQDRLTWVRADAPIDHALSLMQEHKVRRLPVIDENKRLCGMISEADIARHMPQEKTGEMVGAIAAAEPQHF